MFKQFLQADGDRVCQIDACRLGGVNEVLAVLLLAAEFGVPVCPHAGGVGLCELVQHLSAIDYIAVSGSLDGRMIEYVDHLHEHFLDPVVIRDARYVLPTRPGYSAEMRPSRWRATGSRTATSGGRSPRRSRPRPPRGRWARAVTVRRFGQRIRVRPEAIEEYERAPRRAVAGRPRPDPPLEHPELHDLPRRDGPVRLLRVRRRRLRGRHGGDGRRPRDAALVGAHRRDAGAAPRSRARHVVEDDLRKIFHTD